MSVSHPLGVLIVGNFPILTTQNSPQGFDRCFALTSSDKVVNLMAEQCFKKKLSNPPVCGVHNVPLIKAKLPYEFLAAGFKGSTFLVCPVGGEVLTDGAEQS